MEPAKRRKVIERIEMILVKNCRECPENQAYHTTSKICQRCPALAALQEEGRKLGGVDDGTEITDEQFAFAEARGISRSVVVSRVWHKGWDVERAITKKIEKKRRKK